MNHTAKKWLRVSLVNLCLVSILGVILRYKIAFSLPFIDQKHLLHGHSHFAFAGWITHTLMVLLITYLSGLKGEAVFSRYKVLLYANLITAYGMLISFPLQGYGVWSISFSTLSIFTSYAFAIMYWKDLNECSPKSITHLCLKAAVFFNALSSLGAFSLAYMMITKNMHQNSYLVAVYFFLHFQYNGWFFFGILGMVLSKLDHIVHFQKSLKIIVLFFLTACFPAFFLSALWLPIPGILYILVVLAAFVQVWAWILFIRLIIKYHTTFSGIFPVKGRWLLLLSAIALTIKFLLQLGSTIPSLSQLAFGFRPIVVGYLHLVLLGVISIFLIGYLVSFKFVQMNKLRMIGIIVFVSGVILNEILLMTQGAAALNYIVIPNIDPILFITAIILFTGILLMNINSEKRSQMI